MAIEDEHDLLTRWGFDPSEASRMTGYTPPPPPPDTDPFAAAFAQHSHQQWTYNEYIRATRYLERQDMRESGFTDDMIRVALRTDEEDRLPFDPEQLPYYQSVIEEYHDAVEASYAEDYYERHPDRRPSPSSAA